MIDTSKPIRYKIHPEVPVKYHGMTDDGQHIISAKWDDCNKHYVYCYFAPDFHNKFENIPEPKSYFYNIYKDGMFIGEAYQTKERADSRCRTVSNTKIGCLELTVVDNKIVGSTIHAS